MKLRNLSQQDETDLEGSKADCKGDPDAQQHVLGSTFRIISLIDFGLFAANRPLNYYAH